MMNYREKILTWPEAEIYRGQLANKGCKLVFTNGCFDLLHPGHLRYLNDARSLGDKLLVGLNSDRSVKSLKGDSRPVLPQEVRAEMLAGLLMVDRVVIFDEETPLMLITTLSPDVLVKGGDWPVEKIVGGEFVIGGGGLVKSLLMAEGFSTTAIIERIVKRK